MDATRIYYYVYGNIYAERKLLRDEVIYVYGLHSQGSLTSTSLHFTHRCERT